MASRWPRLLEQPEGIWRACNLILEFEGIVGGNSDLAVSVELGYPHITASWDDPGGIDDPERDHVFLKLRNNYHINCQSIDKSLHSKYAF